MPVACAGCGCLVERGVRVGSCADAACCCGAIPSSASLDALAAELRRAFAAKDLAAFGALLAADVRWGADAAGSRCRGRAEVVATFGRLLGEGVDGEVAETATGPAGVLCRLAVRWPDDAGASRRRELFHLYRVRGEAIVEIEPFDERDAAVARLAAG